MRLKNKILPDSSIPVGVMRFKVCKGNEPLNNLFEYMRSRTRIARSSALNFGITSLLAVIFVLTRAPGLSGTERWGYAFLVLLLGGTLSLGAIYAWYRLVIAYFTFVKSNYDYYYNKPGNSDS
ncbi:hypothetical protein D6779_03705 [Candidatus Parcubacteria bacterium]|nr:MAG: hypothetical protein D6779_03705 [Candidatus Parcubacteria bacterium]